MNCEIMGHEGPEEPAVVCGSCFDRAIRERDEALKLAEEFKDAALDYRNDAKEGMSDYLWEKHHGCDHELYPHLIEPPP